MQTIRLTIPQPCHERWNAMNPAGENKMHCGACDRVLVDFSKMSDTELALWFSQSKGKVCGRFSASQLERQLQVPGGGMKKKRRWLNAIWLLPLGLFAKPAAAQNGSPEITKSKPPVSVRTDRDQTAAQEIRTEKKTEFSGLVTDGNTGKPLNQARITLSDKNGKLYRSTQTNADGKYKIELPEGVAESELMISIQKEDFETQYVYVGENRHQETTMYPEMTHVKMGIVIIGD